MTNSKLFVTYFKCIRKVFKQVILGVLTALVHVTALGNDVNTGQRTYFDQATFNEIVEQSPTSTAQENEIRIRDFISSAAFSFNEQISKAIMENGRHYVNADLEKRAQFTFFPPSIGKLVDPKFHVDTVINKPFLMALMKIYAEAVRDIAKYAPDFLNVMAYPNRDAAHLVSVVYYYCLQAAAVGIHGHECMKQLDPQLAKDGRIEKNLARAYITAYRISRFQFSKFHANYNPQNGHRPSYMVKVTEDTNELRWNKSAITPQQLKELAIFEIEDFEGTAECNEVRSAMKAVQAILDSQAPCTSAQWLCGHQHTEANRRKVTVPFIENVPFASAYIFNRPSQTMREDNYKFLELRSVCPMNARDVR